MDTSKIIEEVLNIEKEEDLLNKSISGVFFWERIRNKLITDIKADKDMVDQNATEASFRILAERFLMLLKNIAFRNPFMASQREIMFVGSPRRKKLDGLWYDVYCDPIIEQFDLDYVLFEEAHPIENDHKMPVKTNNLRYLDLLYYTAAIPRIIGLGKSSLTKDEKELISKVENHLNTRLSVDIDLTPRILHNTNRRKFLLPFYRLLLKKVRPKVVIVVRPSRRTLMEACRQEGIKVIELQHGNIHQENMNYNFPHSSPKFHPDIMFLWGEYWIENSEIPMKKENLYAVGYPFLEERLGKFEGSSEKILFLSQWDIGKQLAEIAVNLSSITSEQVIFKLHPEEYSNWGEKYPKLRESDVSVVEDQNIYQLFADSKVQIGVYSTALYEGLAFGLRTILVDLPGIENMKDLAYHEGVENANNCEEIYQMIDSNENIVFDREPFFEPEPYENLEEIFTELGVEH